MNAETFKKVFLPYHQKLYRIAFRILSDKAEAEDAVQETFIKLWNKRHELQSIDNTEGFSVIVLRNICLDMLRKEHTAYKTDYDTEIAETDLLENRIEKKDSLYNVEQLINKLPEQQRQVMQLKHWDGCSDKEIEKITGLSTVNIRVILSRSRKAIREEFIKLDK